MDYLEETIEAVSQQIDVVIAPFTDAIERLASIPGVKKRTAEVIVAEIGVDMSVFPTAAHLASWAGRTLPRQQRERREASFWEDS